MIPAMISFAIVPWGGTLELSQLPFGLARTLGVEGITVRLAGAVVNVGMIYLLAVASLGVYGVALGGWASNSKFSFLGGLRASAQMISYEIPMGLALLCVVLTAGTLDPYAIIEAQSHGNGMWNLLQHPVAAVLFYTCMLAESNRAPFDLAEAESELVGGYHTEYSSMRFAMFFLAEYFHMITGSALFCVLFLGGFSLNPFGAGPDLPLVGGPLLILAQFGILAGKIFLVVSLGMAIRWTVPRFRYDQLMRLAWEGMIPASVLVLAATALMVYWGRTDLMWLASIACVVVIYAVRPLLPKQPNANQRIRIIGSRFSPVTEGDAAPRHPLALNESAVPDPAQGPISMH
jgi:NADH-quinone oxidoreductase subunit H